MNTCTCAFHFELCTQLINCAKNDSKRFFISSFLEYQQVQKLLSNADQAGCSQQACSLVSIKVKLEAYAELACFQVGSPRQAHSLLSSAIYDWDHELWKEVKLDIHTSLLSSENMYACSLQEEWYLTLHRRSTMDAITKPLYTYVTFTKPYCTQQIHYTSAHPLHYLDKLTKGFHTHIARQALSGRGEIKSVAPLSGSFYVSLPTKSLSTRLPQA